MGRKYSNSVILYDPNKINDNDVSGLIEDYLGIAAGISEDLENHYAAEPSSGGLDAYRTVTNRTIRRSFLSFARSQGASVQRLADDTFFLRRIEKQ